MDARTWDERYAESELLWSAGPNKFVAAELGSLRPGRAVDVACGEGRNALWLADRGWDVTAVDFSLTGLDKGRALQTRHEHGRDMHINWVHADVLEHDFGSQQFDLVVIAYLQVPGDERHHVVRRTFESLTPGGTFFVVAHDSTNLTEGTGGPQDPSVLYTAEDVLADLDGMRFEVEHADRVERVVAPSDDSSHAHTGEPAQIAYDALVKLTRDV
jgi:ubiquinone/menaquinone biosynthesis C-methylase UbiE